MFGWGRPKRDIPSVDYTEDSSEEEFEQGLNFSSPLQSPTRPVQTRAGSPVDLQYPTLGDNVDEELNQVRQTLQNIGHTSLFRPNNENLKPPSSSCDDIDGTEEIVEGRVAAAAEDLEVENAAEGAVMATFEDENGADDDRALSNALRIIQGFEWKPNEINFYFNQLEIKMTTAGVKKKTIVMRKVTYHLNRPENKKGIF